MRSASSSAMSARALRAVPYEEVEEHGCEQDRALERVGPVAVPLRVDDSELHHPEHRGTEERADHRAVAARQEAAADDRADDEDELEANALLRLHRAQLERLDDAHQRGNAGRGHE